MKKKEEEQWKEEEHRKLGRRMIRNAEGGQVLLHKITKSMGWRGGVHILKEEKEDAMQLASCEEKEKEWAEHWQCDTKVQDPNDEL